MAENVLVPIALSFQLERSRSVSLRRLPIVFRVVALTAACLISRRRIQLMRTDVASESHHGSLLIIVIKVQ